MYKKKRRRRNHKALRIYATREQNVSCEEPVSITCPYRLLVDDCEIERTLATERQPELAAVIALCSKCLLGTSTNLHHLVELRRLITRALFTVYKNFSVNKNVQSNLL